MIVGRIVGRLFWALALMAAGAEAVRSIEAMAWMPLALGEIWYALDVSSLNLVQAVVQRYLHPAIWDPVLIAGLRAPFWLHAGVLGTLALWLFRVRQERLAPRRQV